MAQAGLAHAGDGMKHQILIPDHAHRLAHDIIKGAVAGDLEGDPAHHVLFRQYATENAAIINDNQAGRGGTGQ